jgi:hypothetical protein
MGMTRTGRRQQWTLCPELECSLGAEARPEPPPPRVAAAPAYIIPKIPCYELLSVEGLARIERTEDRILAKIGIERRGWRKLIIAPDGSPAATPEPEPDQGLIKTLVKAHCWRRRIESGRAKSSTDPAAQEGVTDAYVCRLLPLDYLAPDMVAAMLDGRQPKGKSSTEVLALIPPDREEQRTLLPRYSG